MKKTIVIVCVLIICGFSLQAGQAALVVPNEIQQPGTQPNEVNNLVIPGISPGIIVTTAMGVTMQPSNQPLTGAAV